VNESLHLDKEMTRPTVFISYSHKDELEKDKLVSHLGVLQSAGLISLWSDQEIGAGADWEQTLNQAMSQAKVAILLISANYLTSDFILGKEIPALLHRHQQEGLIIFSIIATACAWRMVDWLAQTQIRPKSGKPVWSDGGSHVNEDLSAIAEEIGETLSRTLAGTLPPTPPVNEPPLQTLDERDWESLLYRIKTGKCTPFLGPEVSQDFVKSDQEIAQSWAREHAYPLNDPHNMPRVAQFLTIKRDPAFPADEVARYLALMDRAPDANNPDEPHHFLAGLPLPLYITTNYDPFMMQALKNRSRNVTREICRWNRDTQSLPSIFDPGSPANISAANPVVYHLFGHADIPESLVVTEDDYLDFLVNISRNQTLIPRQIERALVGTSLLFIGYQLTDLRFRVLFRGLITSLERSLRRASIAVQLNPEPPDIEGLTAADVRAYVEEYLARDEVRVYWGDSFEFIRELRSRWESFNG
jgi:hypothetical protein